MGDLFKILLVVTLITAFAITIAGLLIFIWFDPDAGRKLALSGVLGFVCVIGLLIFIEMLLCI